ncbi:MAG: anti-sigma regulatory factor [Actinomycetota bacterium]
MIESLGSVVVTVPAQAASVHVLRAVVASVAARLELSIDAVEEMRIAIDEAAALLLQLDGATVLRAQISADASTVATLLSTDGAVVSEWPPPGAERSWPWRVITGLCDEAAFERSVDGPAILMRRDRGAGAGE